MSDISNRGRIGAVDGDALKETTYITLQFWFHSGSMGQEFDKFQIMQRQIALQNTYGKLTGNLTT
jgi:hypothetical protein